MQTLHYDPESAKTSPVPEPRASDYDISKQQTPGPNQTICLVREFAFFVGKNNYGASELTLEREAYQIHATDTQTSNIPPALSRPPSRVSYRGNGGSSEPIDLTAEHAAGTRNWQTL